MIASQYDVDVEAQDDNVILNKKDVRKRKALDAISRQNSKLQLKCHSAFRPFFIFELSLISPGQQKKWSYRAFLTWEVFVCLLPTITTSPIKLIVVLETLTVSSDNYCLRLTLSTSYY
jgi:hypothetical protein